MSTMKMCDKCKVVFYEDSRSPRGAYCALKIEYVSGTSTYHLCKKCLKVLWTEFIGDMTKDEFDDEYGED